MFRIRGSSTTSTKLSLDLQIKKLMETFTNSISSSISDSSNISDNSTSSSTSNTGSDSVVSQNKLATGKDIDTIRGEIKKYVDIFTQTILNIQGSSKTIFLEEDTEVVVPQNIKQIFISLVAGGGAGGYGDSLDGLFYSGGGGGAGGGNLKIPLKIEDNSQTIKFICKVGKGGTYENPDGGDTEINIMNNENLFTTITVKGGLRGGNGFSNYGGKGGNSFTDLVGGDGKKGSVILSSHVPIGGEGGSSLFFNGGRGFTYSIQNQSICKGKWGSGGGGIIPAMEQKEISSGGDGFILLEYL